MGLAFGAHFEHTFSINIFLATITSMPELHFRDSEDLLFV